MFEVTVKRSASHLKVKNNLIQNNTTLYGPELDAVADNAVNEYELNMNKVHEMFKNLIYQVKGDRDLEEVLTDVARIMRLKYENPLRAPRIVLLGPAGSGRST